MKSNNFNMYKLYVYVCSKCHHTKLTRVPGATKMQGEICIELGLDWEAIRFIMRKVRPQWTEAENNFMEAVKEKMTAYWKRLKEMGE